MSRSATSAGQNEQILWSVPPWWVIPKIVSVYMSSDHRNGNTIRFPFTSIIQLPSVVEFIETWHENLTTSTCPEGENIFRENLRS